MQKRWTGTIVAGAAGLVMAAATFWLFCTKLKQPQTGFDAAALMDWSALIFAGLTTGIISFFVVWGHFQKDPPPQRPE